MDQEFGAGSSENVPWSQGHGDGSVFARDWRRFGTEQSKCVLPVSGLSSALRHWMREKKNASPGANSWRHTPIDMREIGQITRF